MKRIIIIFSLFAGALSASAQSGCSKDHTIYKFSNAGSPKIVTQLGSAPEFPYLRNMASKEQLFAAINRNQGKKDIQHLDDILMGIGFSRGSKDLTQASISQEMIPPGTIGNMGSAQHKYVYADLTGRSGGFKAWKITSDNGCYVYILQPCGNTFYPKSADAVERVTVVPEPVTESESIVVREAPRKECRDKVYLSRRGGIVDRGSRGWDAYPDQTLTEKCNGEEIVQSSDTYMHVERSADYAGYKKAATKNCYKPYYRTYHRAHKCGCRR